jgi:hypothetical protein
MSDAPVTWLSRKQAARYLTDHGCPISAKTLANLASNNNAKAGPSFTRMRKSVRYDAADLKAWAAQEAVKVN